MRDRPVVVGGGPSGLAAAWALCQGGEKPIVLEAEERVGGLAASFDFHGFQVDYGPHRLHRAASEEVQALYRSLLGPSLLERERKGMVHLREGLLPFPLSLLGLFSGLGPGGLVRHGTSALWSRIRPPKGDDYGAEVSRRLGRRALQSLYGPAARKVWGLGPEALDGALGRARVQKKGIADVLRSTSARAAGRRFFYPGQGCGSLAERLAERIVLAGGEVRTSSPALGLSVEGGAIRGVLVEGGILQTDRVIATAALPTLCKWVGSEDAGAGLTFRGLVLLYLLLDKDRLADSDVQYFADEAIPANRLFEMKGFSDGAGPKGRTAIGFDLPCNVGDGIWNASPEDLVERVRPALARVGAGDCRILHASSRRLPFAYPMYRKGFAALREKALGALAAVQGLYPLGRCGLFVHDNVHHALAAGLEAGRSAARREDPEAWRERARPHLFAQVED